MTKNVFSEFREFELRGWENAFEGYHHAFGPLTQQTIDPMLDLLGVRKGRRLLDVATGPGFVAAAAKRRGASVVGVDFSPAMLRLAKQLSPEIDFRLGDAEALEFGDEEFDAVAMNFGILHLSKPEAAVKEAARVLKSGGRFAFSAWDTPDKAVGFEVVLNAVAEHGAPEVKLPEGPPFFYFSEERNGIGVMERAGFRDAAVQRLPLTWRVPSPEAFFSAIYEGSARTGGLLRAQPADRLAAIRAAILESARERFGKGGEMEIPMPALLYSGRIERR